MGALRCIGSYVPLFFIAILLDVFGLVLIFIGIFANLRVDGRFYGDFLIYSGALVIFFSLAYWLMWYVANVPVREEEEQPEKRNSLVRLARKLSERLSRRLQVGKGDRVDQGDRGDQEGEECNSHTSSSPPRKASRVTWGRSAVYINGGYVDSLDETHKSPGVQENT